MWEDARLDPISADNNAIPAAKLKSGEQSNVKNCKHKILLFDLSVSTKALYATHAPQSYT
jgi:hypothetical protein